MGPDATRPVCRFGNRGLGNKARPSHWSRVGRKTQIHQFVFEYPWRNSHIGNKGGRNRPSSALCFIRLERTCGRQSQGNSSHVHGPERSSVGFVRLLSSDAT